MHPEPAQRAMAGTIARTRHDSRDPLPDPVAPAISTWVPWSRMVSCRRPHVVRPAGRGGRAHRDRQGREDGGKRVAAEQLQDDPAWASGAHPAPRHTETM